MSSDAKVLGFQEVAKHNHRDDCWLLISGKVYNVTPFLYEHPGGEEILLTSVGIDATEDFEDIGHSKSAREIMKRYFVGDIDISTVPPKRKPPQNSSDQVMMIKPYRHSGFLLKLLQSLLAAFWLAAAFAFFKYKIN